MRRSWLVVQEGEGYVLKKDVVIAKATSDDEEDDGILSPSKPSHIEFGKSTVKPEYLILMKKLGYFGKNDDKLIRFAGDEVILSQEMMKLLFLRASSELDFDSLCMK
jgi:hypothetical protein